MSELYEDYKNLICLFNYARDDDPDMEMYRISCIYIDKTTGKLISRTSETNSPYDIRPGSYSRVYEREISYSRMKEILRSPGFAAEVKDAVKYTMLNENSWEQWLVKNGYIKETKA